MPGNVAVHSRQYFDARAIARVALGSPWLAAILCLTAGFLAARPAAARSTCPLTTAVLPFEQTGEMPYRVVLTDGGEGDLDGLANGSCDVAIRLCRSARPMCDAATIVGGGVRVGGGSGALERSGAAARIDAALDTVIASNADDSADHCSVGHVSLAASEDA